MKPSWHGLELRNGSGRVLVTVERLKGHQIHPWFHLRVNGQQVGRMLSIFQARRMAEEIAAGMQEAPETKKPDTTVTAAAWDLRKIAAELIETNGPRLPPQRMVKRSVPNLPDPIDGLKILGVARALDEEDTQGSVGPRVFFIECASHA